MGPSWFDISLSGIIQVYLCQAFIGLFMFFVFRYFAALYQRWFLTAWSLSWLAFMFFVLSAALSTSMQKLADMPMWARLCVTYVSVAGSFLQVAFLLTGCYELVRNFRLPQRLFFMLLAVIMGVALALVLYKYADPTAGNVRYFLRVGVKYFTLSAGFLYAAVLTLRNQHFTRGVGQKILAAGFLLYGIINLYYATIVTRYVYSGIGFFPDFFGLLELLCISGVAIGMVLWLLEDERQRLQKINKELDGFIYRTSHDLRSPLASVQSLLQLALNETTDNASRQYFELINNRVQKLDLVITDILQLSRSTKGELKFEPLYFDDLLKEVSAGLSFEKNGRTISFQYTAGRQQLVTDAYQLKAILLNLLSNAIKYHYTARENPFVRVEFTKTNREVVIAVVDNGEGIAREHQKRVFDMFYRASTSAEGTGLGLYIVHEAVQKLNGQLSLESEHGKGSRFEIRLPVRYSV
jgi:signal transduction histidine kinase